MHPPTDHAHPPEAVDVTPEAGVLRNSSWALMSQVISAAISAGVLIFAVRIVSVPAWGHYMTALALIAIAVLNRVHR